MCLRVSGEGARIQLNAIAFTFLCHPALCHSRAKRKPALSLVEGNPDLSEREPLQQRKVKLRIVLLILAAAALAACKTAPSCPPGTKQMGEAPPDGSETWCAKTVNGGGRKEGPFLLHPPHGSKMIEGPSHEGQQSRERTLRQHTRPKHGQPAGLPTRPACCIFLAYSGAPPIGFSICFPGFSTFNARPLVNIHDIFVESSVRGKGIGRMLLERIETKARELNCCRLTLEVREDNQPARTLYRKVGFDRALVGPNKIRMEFWRKPLE